jgi:hypothetical protein
MANMISAAHLEHIAKLTVELVKIRAADTPHVSTENVGPETFKKLLNAFNEAFEGD